MGRTVRKCAETRFRAFPTLARLILTALATTCRFARHTLARRHTPIGGRGSGCAFAINNASTAPAANT
eukprot:6202726-Pleurochrysis_carterae.AAC.2